MHVEFIENVRYVWNRRFFRGYGGRPNTLIKEELITEGELAARLQFFLLGLHFPFVGFWQSFFCLAMGLRGWYQEMNFAYLPCKMPIERLHRRLSSFCCFFPFLTSAVFPLRLSPHPIPSHTLNNCTRTFSYCIFQQFRIMVPDAGRPRTHSESSSPHSPIVCLLTVGFCLGYLPGA